MSDRPVSGIGPARFAIIILNWNRGADTITCLENIRTRADAKPAVIVVVDNGSKDDSLMLLQEYGAGTWGHVWEEGQEAQKENEIGRVRIIKFHGSVPLELLCLEENAGGAGGRNAGISRALESEDWDWAFFLDNDAVLDERTIPALFRTAESAQADVVGCVVRNPDGSLQFAGLHFVPNMFYIDIGRWSQRYDFGKAWRLIDEVSSCGMLVSRTYLEELLTRRGFCFNPGYFHWSEDQEICLQARAWGYRVAMAGDAVVVHQISAGSAGRSAAYYYSGRNRVFLGRHFLPAGLWPPFVVFFAATRLARALIALVRGRRELAAAHIQGFRDGWKGESGRWKRQPQFRAKF